jgi:potassium efflux system protein
MAAIRYLIPAMGNAPEESLFPTPLGRGARALAPLLLGVLLLALPLAAAAQEKKSESAGEAAAEQPVEEPQAIRAAELAEQSQQAHQRLAKMQVDAEQLPEVLVIEEQLPAAEKRISESSEKARAVLASEPSANQVENLAAEWLGRRQASIAWRKTLEDRLTALGTDLEALGQIRLRWEETRASAKEEKLPRAVRKRIDDTLAEIAKTEKAVRGRRSTLLTLQTRVAEEEAAISALLDEIETARGNLRDQLLRFDSPPLWTALVDVERNEGDLGAHLQISWRDDSRVIKTYFEARHQAVFFYLVGMGLLGLALITLRTHAKGWAEEDPAFEASAQILGRPFSALAVVALLAIPMVFRSSPPIVNASVGMILVAPALRLLTPVLSASLRRGLYCLGLWYVIDWFRFVLVRDPLSDRVLLLLLTLAVVVFLLWLLRPARLAALRSTNDMSVWLRFIGRGVRLGLVLLVVSTIANVLGNVSLAEMLSNGCLVGAYLAYIVYAAGRVLDGVYAGLLRTDVARRSRMVRYHGHLLRKRGRTFIRVVLTLVWARAVLRNFEVLDPLSEAAKSILNARAAFGDIGISLGGILAFGISIYATFLISRAVRFVLEEDVLPRASLPRGVPYALSTAAHYVILFVGFLLAVSAVGFDLSRFALMAGALGVGIGIGLQDVVNNFVSGLILLFERPIQTGDTVEVGGVMGEVRRIGLRSSTVRTWDGAEVVIPNARFVSDQFVNWTLSDRQRRMTISVGVKYGTDPERVLEILLERANSHPDVLETPSPVALFNGFGDSSLDFEVRAWTLRADSWRQVQSEITIFIDSALKEAGIEIPFPQRDLHLRSVDPDVSIK